MHSPNASLDRGSRDARDELVEEEVVDDRDRYPDEQRARHERAPEVHVAPDQLRRHAERHRLLLGDGDEGERVEEVLHGQREREDHRRDHPRPAHRQHHAQERAELAAPVDHRRLLDLERHRLEEPHEEPGAERDREGRVHDDQRPPGVLEAELAHDPRERDEQDDRRDEVRHEDGDPQILGERQPEPRERVADRKSTRLNSSHTVISYAVFCLKKKKRQQEQNNRNYAKYKKQRQKKPQQQYTDSHIINKTPNTTHKNLTPTKT